MQLTVADFGNDSVVYNITGTTKEELENKLNLFFSAERLPFKNTDGKERIYQRGNKVLRVLFGAFVKYFRVAVSVREENGMFGVRIRRDMNLAMSGGLIGINKSRKEFARISDAFKAYINSN
jgi:hypothetical protein